MNTKQTLTANILKELFYYDSNTDRLRFRDGRRAAIKPNAILNIDGNDYTAAHVREFLRLEREAQHVAVDRARALGPDAVKDVIQVFGARRISDLPFHHLQTLIGHLNYLLEVEANKVRLAAEAQARKVAYLAQHHADIAAMLHGLLDPLEHGTERVLCGAYGQLPHDHEAMVLCRKLGHVLLEVGNEYEPDEEDGSELEFGAF